MGEGVPLGDLQEGVTGQSFLEENAPLVLSATVLLPTDTEAGLGHRWRDPGARTDLARRPPCVSPISEQVPPSP